MKTPYQSSAYLQILGEENFPTKCAMSIIQKVWWTQPLLSCLLILFWGLNVRESVASTINITRPPFNAVCNGRANDTRAVQDAINSLRNGDTLLIPGLTGIENPGLVVRNLRNVTIIGTGTNAGFIALGNDFPVVGGVTLSNTMILIRDCQYLTFRNLLLEANNFDFVPICFSSTLHCTMSYCEVRNIQAVKRSPFHRGLTGISSMKSKYLTIYHNTIHNLRGFAEDGPRGIWVGGLSNAEADEFDIIRKNAVINNRFTGIACHSSFATIDSNEIYNSGASGIKVNTPQITNGGNVVIAHNRIVKHDFHGIQINCASPTLSLNNVVIEHNFIDSIKHSGIGMFDPTRNITIRNNSITNVGLLNERGWGVKPGEGGIYCTSTTANLRILNNVFSARRSGGALAQGVSLRNSPDNPLAKVSIRNVTIENNTFRNFGYNGVSLLSDSTGLLTMDSVTIRANTFEQIGSAGIEVTNRSNTIAAISSCSNRFVNTRRQYSLTNYSLERLTSSCPEFAPVMFGFSPASAAQGEVVTIRGRGFSRAVSVHFGGTQAASFSIVSDSVVTAVVGNGSSGSVAVNLPTSVLSLAGFTFQARVPIIHSFSPPSGRIGDTMLIRGAFLSNASRVGIGGASVRFTVLADTLVQAVVSRDVRSGVIDITTPNGRAHLAGFTFLPPPAIASFSPSSASFGETVMIAGTGFTGTTLIGFGGAMTNRFTILSDTQIQVVVPHHASSGTISILTPNGRDSLAGFQIVIRVPSIQSFVPVIAGANASVLIQGRNFFGATSVRFGGIPAARFTILSDTQITAVIATGASGSVSVQSPTGISSADGFTFVPQPIITAVKPMTAILGDTVTIEGQHLSTVSIVSFGGVPSRIVSITPSQVKVIVGQGSSGDIQITTLGGTTRISGFVFGRMVTSVLRSTLVSSAVSVFPNPATELITVQGDWRSNETLNLLVINELGIETIMMQLHAQEIQQGVVISLKNFPRGVYIVRLQSKEKLEFLKIVKQ